MFVDICATTMRQQTLERGEAQLSGKYLFMNLNQVLAWLFMILSKITKHENPFGRHCIYALPDLCGALADFYVLKDRGGTRKSSPTAPLHI